MELLNKESAAPTVNPREFNGQWFFTNPDTEDFTAYWNSTPYTFPAMSTSPLVIMDATPIETQNIRKQFALKLAQRMFGKSPKWRKLVKESEGRASPAFYDQTKEYEPYIQQCLTALPVVAAKVGRRSKKDIPLNIDPTTGKPSVRVFGEQDNGNVSLVEEALNAQ